MKKEEYLKKLLSGKVNILDYDSDFPESCVDGMTYDELLDDKSFMTELVNNVRPGSRILWDLNDQISRTGLGGDEEFMLSYIKKCPSGIHCLSRELRENRKFLSKVFEINGVIFADTQEDLEESVINTGNNDLEFAKKAVDSSVFNLREFHDFPKIKDLILYALDKKGTNAIRNIPRDALDHLKDESFVLKLAQQNLGILEYEFAEYFPPRIRLSVCKKLGIDKTYKTESEAAIKYYLKSHNKTRFELSDFDKQEIEKMILTVKTWFNYVNSPLSREIAKKTTSINGKNNALPANKNYANGNEDPKKYKNSEEHGESQPGAY